MLPVFIYVFEPAVPNTVLKRIGSFESRLAGSSSNIVCLLYSGTNHYDVIDDPVFVDRSGELCLIVLASYVRSLHLRLVMVLFYLSLVL